MFPGTRIQTPEIRRLKDNKIVRASEVIIAGPAGLQLHSSPLVLVIRRLVLVHVLLTLWYSLAYALMDPKSQYFIPPSHLLGIYVGAYGLMQGMRWVLYQSGRRGLVRTTHDLCTTSNQFHYSSLEKGSEASQPSALHRYWMMRVDISREEGLFITHTIHPDQQKYWSIVVYDECGLCLPQYVYDDNYLAHASTARTNTNNKLYPVRVLLSPGGEEDIDFPEKTAPSVRVDIRSLGVGNGRFKGYVLFRLVHPSVWTDKIAANGPVVEVVSSDGEGQGDREGKKRI